MIAGACFKNHRYEVIENTLIFYSCDGSVVKEMPITPEVQSVLDLVITDTEKRILIIENFLFDNKLDWLDLYG